MTEIYLIKSNGKCVKKAKPFIIFYMNLDVLSLIRQT